MFVESTPAPKRVLVVDDEPQIRMVLSMFLAGRGWETVAAADPDQAVAQMERGPFTHALIDLHLGMHSGYDLIRTILARWPSTRVVAITGSVVAGRQAALAAGAAGCLSKPFSSLQEVCDALEGNKQ